LPADPYQIIRYTPDWKDQVAEFQKPLWGPNVDINRTYLEWKHERNPYVDTPFVYLAIFQGRVVGMRGIYGAGWQVGQSPQVHVLPVAADFLIDPEHRDRRLVTLIMKTALEDLAQEGFTYILNFSGGPITRISALAAGWRSTGFMHSLQRRSRKKQFGLRLEGLARRLHLFPRLKLAPSVTPQQRSNPFQLLEESIRGSSGPVVFSRKPCPKEMAELMERLGRDGRFRHVRDEQFYAWRYRDPRSQYAFLYLGDTQLEGYLVLRTSVYPHLYRVSIVDWQGTNDRVLNELLVTAIGHGGFLDLTVWSTTLPGSSIQLLQSYRFKPEQKLEGVADITPAVLVRALSGSCSQDSWSLDGNNLLNMDNWNLRMIDSDAF